MDAAREYLVEQLVIVATHLADSHISHDDPDLPLCRDCFMSGINGRPIPHLPSCAVGRVLSAIEQLRAPADGRPLASWDHGDFASRRALPVHDECPMCGPRCVGGAHRTALREDGITTREQYEALKSAAPSAQLAGVR